MRYDSATSSAFDLSTPMDSSSNQSSDFQFATSSRQRWSETMQKSLETNTRSFQRRNRSTLRERTRLSTREVTDRISEALSDIPAKELADASGSSIRAAESAKQGLHSMSLAYFFNACRNVPELQAIGMELMGCGDIPDPKVLRGLQMILRGGK